MNRQGWLTQIREKGHVVVLPREPRRLRRVAYADGLIIVSVHPLVHNPRNGGLTVHNPFHFPYARMPEASWEELTKKSYGFWARATDEILKCKRIEECEVWCHFPPDHHT